VDTLRPLDLVVALKLHSMEGSRRTYQRLAEELGISVSQAHKAVRRAAEARVLGGASRLEDRALRTRPVLPFLTDGVRFVFFPTFGPEARGVVTGTAGLSGETELVGGKQLVWPAAWASDWGMALEPLDKCVPRAAQADGPFRRSLVLIDLVRVGGTREREVASRLLAETLLRGGP
jgi:hypothetical protein